MAERKGQNDPNKATTEEIEAQRDSPEFQPRQPTRPYAKWKGGGFLVPFLIFLCASHNL